MASIGNSDKVKIISYSGSPEKRILTLDNSKLKEIIASANNVPVAIICVTSRENPAITELIRSCFISNVTNSQGEPCVFNKVKLDPTVEVAEPGIWLTSSPFLIEVGMEKIGILFLEARGRPIDANSENEEEWSQLLGLSFLISSHVILPSSKFIQENLLMTIKNNCPNIDEYSGKSEAFQNLHFLIYDYTSIKHKYGSKGGYDMLHSKLEIQERQAELAQKIRKTIKKSFDNLRCFLMPNTGQFFKDGAAVYGGNFAQLMTQFIMDTFYGPSMRPKRFLNQEILGSSVCFFFEKCIHSINKKANIPLHDAVLDISHDIAIRQAFVFYVDNMKNEMVGKSDTEILGVHKILKGKAVENFSSYTGASSGVDLLEEKIDEEFQKLKKNIALGGNCNTEEKIYGKVQHADKKVTTEENYDSDANADEEFENLAAKEGKGEESDQDFGKVGESFQKLELEDILKGKADLAEDTDEIFKEMVTENFPDQNFRDHEDFEEIASYVISETNNSDQRLDMNEGIVKEDSEFQASHVEEDGTKKNRIVLEKIIENIIQSCESDADFPATVEMATEMGEEAKMNAVKSFNKETSQFSTNQFDLLDEYREKMEKSIDDFYNTLKIHIQSKIRNSKQVIEEIVHRVQNQLSKDFATEDDIRKAHRELSTGATQKLTADNKLPSSAFNEILEELNTKLDTLNNEVMSDFRSKETCYRAAYNASVKYYEEKMVSALEEREYLIDEQFEAVNARLISQAEDNFEKFPYPRVSPLLHSEFFERLQGKLEYCGKDASQKNAERKIFVEENVFRRKALCMAQYDAKLKNAFKTTNDEHSLQLLHQKTKKDVEEAFQEYNSERDVQLWQETFGELIQDIQTSYESIQDYCLLKWSQQSRISETAMIKASGFYNEYMRACVFEMRYIDPPDLQEMHRKAVDVSLKKCTEIFKSPVLSENQLENISVALSIEFERYESRNLMNLPNDPAIGIDLGTTYSCVAVFNKIKGVVEVLTNRNSGLKITPSYVAYKNGVATVGEAAKEQAPDNPENTVFDAKRMIGRRFDDNILQKDMLLWPFKVVEENESPKIEIDGKVYFPEQISAKVLEEMKKIAEDYLGCKVKKAVITVPAYFNDGQRQATMDAGDIAGLQVLKIINEPTAAAIAFKIEHADAGKRNVLIYDLGGGTFDVAILECVQTKVDVLVVDGDTHLGGVDFDAKMTDYCCAEFKRETGIDLLEGRDSINANKRAGASRILTRLKYACERSKKILSTKPSGEDLIRLDSVVNGVDLHVRVTKELFEEINMDFFEKTIQIVNRAMTAAKLKPVDIDDVVLIGGSTKIPKVQQMLSDNFGGKPLTFKINPDEAVAVGAAFQAAMTNGHITKDSQLYHVTSDVTPFSIGVEEFNKKLSVIIHKNTKVPHKFKQDYRTVQDDQTMVTVAVFQGENPIAADNMPLGKFDLVGIPKAKKGKQLIEVEIEVDPQGVLHVTAKCKSTGFTKTGLSIMGQKWRMTKDNIQQIKTRDKVMATFNK